MSVYMEVYGEVYFDNKKDAKKALDFLKSEDWLREEDGVYKWVSDGYIIEGEGTPIDADYVCFNGGTMRNIGRVLDYIFSEFKIDKKYTHYRTVCMDGTFSLGEYREGHVNVSDEEIEAIIGCPLSDLDYDDEDEENVCSYRSAEEKAYDWVLEG